jgi:hypothetical protein
MYSEDTDATEITFFYDTGESESFSLPIAPEEFQKQVNLLLERPWLTFHLFDRTIWICMARVVKVEVKPELSGIVGVGVFPNVEEMTTIQRGSRGRLPGYQS